MVYLGVKKVLTLLFPPLCVGCEKEGVVFCKECMKDIVAHAGPVQQYTSSGFLDEVYIGFSYSGPIRKAIKYIKYSGAKNYIPLLIEKLYVSVIDNSFTSKNTIITSVPMHWWKKNMIRGYNHGELLGRAFSHISSIPYLSIASKKKRTISQTKLSRTKRKSNTYGVFRIKNIPKHITHIIIVDDLITTGATLYSIAKEIKKVRKDILITGIVVARN